VPHLLLNGASIFYERSGVPGAPVLLLSHALGTTARMWEPLLELLGRQYELIRYDMRGHGQSSTPLGPYLIDQLGHDVLALVDSLHLRRIAFCGISAGGLIGQWLAVNAPENFRAFILCNTAAKIGTPESWNQRIAAVEQGGMAAIADALLARYLTASFREGHPEIAARMREMLAASDPLGYISACAAVRDADLRAAIANVRTPTYIVAGQHDALTTLDQARFMQQQISDSSLVELPAAHISSIEMPLEFAATVLTFLKGQVN
jgi:3-oxoadipate enol-lactonase